MFHVRMPTVSRNYVSFEIAPAHLASEEVYTRVVLRRMLQMTQDINDDWSSHVAESGVNCTQLPQGDPVHERLNATGLFLSYLFVRFPGGSDRGRVSLVCDSTESVAWASCCAVPCGFL